MLYSEEDSGGAGGVYVPGAGDGNGHPVVGGAGHFGQPFGPRTVVLIVL